MRILIAEDNLHHQTSVKTLMKLWGFEYDMVSNGKEAVDYAIANEGKYDLCLMDIDMPILNGFEATKIIRRKLKYFPIMALTGNLPAVEKYLAVGLDDYLEKPYSINNLYNKINRLIVKSYDFSINKKDILIKEEMPMDQQHAQELAGTILTWLHSIYWLILTALVGLNLLIFSLTGFCPSAIMMYKMGVKAKVRKASE